MERKDGAAVKNSAELKQFATSARVTLIEQMRGQIDRVLGDPTIRAENPLGHSALQREVRRRSADWVAETAAYTWFNRLTAARYMDAREFSGLYGVVSPAPGSASTLPEILLRAQAGEYPGGMSDDDRTKVGKLLTRERPSPDHDGEAYALLLRAVFKEWNRPMPDVFPYRVDWITLLVPPDMLAPTSVRARAVEVMDAEVCEDVEVVGWLYQFYNADLKEEINKSKVPIDAAELPAVTQLFTPDWIVRYLVENSLGRLWLRSRPGSGLRDYMKFYVEPIDGQDDTGVTVSTPEEIRIVDPACGSGHMLTYAFDLMYRIYEEEGYTPSSIPRLILANNLRGIEIDERAAQLASFALAMKARDKDRRFLTRSGDDAVQPDIVWLRPLAFEDWETDILLKGVDPADRAAVGDLLTAFADADTFGSLIRVDTDAVHALDDAIGGFEDKDAEGHLTSEMSLQLMLNARAILRQTRALVDGQYHVVVANPPYLGSGNMGTELSAFAKREYPETKPDLYAMFVERNAEFAVPAGSVAMVTMHSWMFLTSYKKFRARMSEWGHLASMAHLGTRGFDSISGEVVQTTAFVIDTESRPGHQGRFFRLVSGRNEAEKAQMLGDAIESGDPAVVFGASMHDFALVPESPVVYWLSEAMKAAFAKGERLGDVAHPRQGLATADNDRFLRQWFEVSANRTGFGMSSRGEAKDSGKKWFPHNKGGSFRKWWGNQDFVINWEVDGKELWDFRPRSVIRNPDYYFRDCVSWSNVSTGAPSFRYYPSDFIFSHVGQAAFGEDGQLPSLMGFLDSTLCESLLTVLSPAMHFEVGHIANLPVIPADSESVVPVVDELIRHARADWDGYEISWVYGANLVVVLGDGSIESHSESRWRAAITTTNRVRELEEQNNCYFAKLYDLEDEVDCEVPLARVSLTQNPYFRYAPTKGTTRTEDEYRTLFNLDLARELVSYAVGCMMGRYSLDKPGLILADAGATLADFDAKVPDTRFRPDDDGIIPITSEHYFEDDIVARMREFLSVAFGPENLNANVEWLETALGSGNRKPLRQYFLKNFYDDHCKMYSNRPIYWQISSNQKTEKGFNAIFYLHRYTPATLGLVRQMYANPLVDKLQARLDTIEHALPTAGKAEKTKLTKERDDLTARQREIREWITKHLFPLSTAEVALDLDDGVKQNYPKLAAVLRKVKGL
ncbi:BREX-1 system adenine-specific DNA-methyltransferase PglX [Gordonia sp. (in: high G+C Gram-positive bacteria)]|uniref:BREX-1 system adenine-specific DNA-methyltransferase PglX n=1 Tax=Gordonia sp. (in: high G+C Gram-positive bacteria) TaxID=84139 RepID=UPI002622F809|nr:BREX-1 system adenine-specific DNA-methyltransferase PglX [Gordonia sp. (in: high G+C Gram-positive bacteria)]HMS76690.1 BREX-1 system adenine-specific DNA-methyltransferase PglX [Gordonia sp. (in: high G+C Gram-positive bacteria)]